MDPLITDPSICQCGYCVPTGKKTKNKKVIECQWCFSSYCENGIIQPEHPINTNGLLNLFIPFLVDNPPRLCWNCFSQFVFPNEDLSSIFRTDQQTSRPADQDEKL